ncbi:MAG: NAD(P)-binding domain-containing protein [Veillonellales bacterium]
MAVGLIGTGRMGRALAARLADTADLYLFDRDADRLKTVGEELKLPVVESMEELVKLGTVILAVPDQEVISCIKDFNQQPQTLQVINIATNVDSQVLRQTSARHIRCINAKFVSQADEMLLGQRPVIIVDEQPSDMVSVAAELFAAMGDIVVGRADLVTAINKSAAENVLTAAVHLEETLRQKNVTDPRLIKAAIRQVAVGTLKAYADSNLGPFAREIVRSVRARLKK